MVIRPVVAWTAAAVMLCSVLTGVEAGAAAAAGGRTAIGDSVMLGAKTQLNRRGFAVDAIVSRQVEEGIDVIRAKRRAGTLHHAVVVHLGTNGTFSFDQCRTMRRAAGSSRSLFLVTVFVPRSWKAGNNRVIHRCAHRFANVWSIAWNRFASHHPWAIEPDGYHLSPTGARAYARLVDRKVDGVLARAGA